MDFVEEAEYFISANNRSNWCTRKCYEHKFRMIERRFAEREAQEESRRYKQAYWEKGKVKTAVNPIHSKHEIQMDPDPIQEKNIKSEVFYSLLKANSLKDDDHYSPVSPKKYIIWRLDKILSYSHSRLPILSCQFHFFSTLALLCTAITSILAFFNQESIREFIGEIITMITAVAAGLYFVHVSH